jgi:actin-like ATPase involved in cell morphogenesis
MSNEADSAAEESQSESEESAETAGGVGSASSSGSATPIGVKLGSTRTVIALPSEHGSGLRTIQTLTCLAEYEDPLTGETKYLYGEEAATEYPDKVQYMLRSGLPEDEDRAELTKQFFNSVIDSHDIPEDSVVVYAVPTINNPAGIENLREVIEQSAIGDQLIESYPESLCGAIPAVGNDLEAVEEIFVALNLGSTNLEASAYRRGEQLSPFRTGAVTGNEVDRAIANYVEEETQGRVNIDTNTAREYKEQHADFDAFEPFTDIIQQPGGGRHEFTIEWSVMEAVDEYLDEVVEEFANTFLAQLANDHMKVYQLALDQPIVLTGGMACIPGVVEEFEQRAAEELGREINAIAPDRADLAATIGAQRIAAQLSENQ